jgi:hypothetical protein
MTQLTDWKGRRKRKQSELLLPIGLNSDESNPRNVRIPMGLNVMLMELNDERKALRFTVPEAELGGVKHILNERCTTHYFSTTTRLRINRQNNQLSR